MLFDGISHQVPDTDPGETEEWLDSFDSVIGTRGRSRGRFLLMKLLERARSQQVEFPATVSTPYVNTIPAVFIFGQDGKELKRFTMDDPSHQFTYDQVEKYLIDLLGSSKSASTGS